MMKEELEQTLGERLDMETWDILHALYMSDDAPHIGGPDGRKFVASAFSRGRSLVKVSADLLFRARRERDAATSELRRLRTANQNVAASLHDAVERESTLQQQLAATQQQLLGAQLQARSTESDVRIASEERDRLTAAMNVLEETLVLMGLDVENIARLAQGVAVCHSVVGECENALSSSQRESADVAATIYGGLTQRKRARERYENEAREAQAKAKNLAEAERRMELAAQTA